MANSISKSRNVQDKLETFLTARKETVKGSVMSKRLQIKVEEVSVRKTLSFKIDNNCNLIKIHQISLNQWTNDY